MSTYSRPSIQVCTCPTDLIYVLLLKTLHIYFLLFSFYLIIFLICKHKKIFTNQYSLCSFMFFHLTITGSFICLSTLKYFPFLKIFFPFLLLKSPFSPYVHWFRLFGFLKFVLGVVSLIITLYYFPLLPPILHVFLSLLRKTIFMAS